ncbi:hypothetical protein [Pseudoalteromonas phage PH357]|nr:hypothetical protein [Pseudoalteromonas phage PH357]
MKIKYICEVVFSDPTDSLFNHKTTLEMILPESTYGVVKEECFKRLSGKEFDFPKEWCKIEYSLISEERL